MTRNKEYYFTTTTVTVYALVNLHSLNTEEWRSVLQNKSDFFFLALSASAFSVQSSLPSSSQ